MTKNEGFIAHLGKSKDRVDSWPEWKKQNADSQIRSSASIKTNATPNAPLSTHKLR